MFSFYLDLALRRVSERLCPINKRNYSSRPDLLSFHVDYAAEAVFILTESDQNVAELMTEVKKKTEEPNPKLIEEKTEKANLLYKKHLGCTRKLGSILDDHADFERKN